ncbi:MAG: amino acid ABC transporter substrate-binding protein [Bradyrhizobiaceae bacterium]|nr:amino acid ABC transporter substrate-binding protein [Bradyrhizobiaceae bacterium]
MSLRARSLFALASALGIVVVVAGTPAVAAEPIKFGTSQSLTGGLAPLGKAMLLTEQMWVEQVNGRGGLLGRPVQLVFYDDQSSPATDPGIYTKILDVDRADILLGNGTNFVSSIMPIVIQRGKTIMAMFALAVNDRFDYRRYFQIMPYGPAGKDEISRGFFEAAMTMTPRPKTVALVGADAEFGVNALEGARTHAERLGLEIVYDQRYPPNTLEFGPVVRAIKATNPDLVFVGSYPPDGAGIVRAALEAKLKTAMFGGGMVGFQLAALKQQFGTSLNGLVNYELFVREPTMRFPGIDQFIAEYRKRAAGAGVDQLGFYIPPFTYAALQVLEQAIIGSGNIEDEKLAAYMHQKRFSTIVGEISFNARGEWTQPQILMTQFQHVNGNDLAQFDQTGTQVILYPPTFKSGDLIYPFPPDGN